MKQKTLSLILLHFNSIKVRLKLPKAIGASPYSLFQFHKGTIKTDGHPATVER